MQRMFRVSLEATAISLPRFLSPHRPMQAMVRLWARDYWDSALERWLAVQSHHKRCMSLRHRPSTTPHLLLFMSRSTCVCMGTAAAVGEYPLGHQRAGIGAHLRPERGFLQLLRELPRLIHTQRSVSQL